MQVTMSTQTSRFNPYWLLVAPAVLLVLALYVAPIVNVLMLSVTDPKPGSATMPRSSRATPSIT